MVLVWGTPANEQPEEPGPEDAVPEEPMLALVELLDARQKLGLAELRDMGFTLEQGMELVLARAPWFRIKCALEQGCTLEQALQIWA